MDRIRIFLELNGNETLIEKFNVWCDTSIRQYWAPDNIYKNLRQKTCKALFKGQGQWNSQYFHPKFHAYVFNLVNSLYDDKSQMEHPPPPSFLTFVSAVQSCILLRCIFVLVPNLILTRDTRKHCIFYGSFYGWSAF